MHKTRWINRQEFEFCKACFNTEKIDKLDLKKLKILKEICECVGIKIDKRIGELTDRLTKPMREGMRVVLCRGCVDPYKDHDRYHTSVSGSSMSQVIDYPVNIGWNICDSCSGLGYLIVSRKDRQTHNCSGCGGRGETRIQTEQVNPRIGQVLYNLENATGVQLEGFERELMLAQPEMPRDLALDIVDEEIEQEINTDLEED